MRLAPGAFFGSADFRAAAGAFTFASRRGDVPPAAVPRHTHDEAHYVLVVSGDYITEARGGGTCGPSTLVFNPAATTHRDRFTEPGGRFFSISLAAGLAAVLDRHQPLAVVLRDRASLPIAAKLYRACLAPDTGSALILEGLGLELVGHTVKGSAPIGRSVPPWLRAVRDRAQDEFARPLTIGALATEAGVHPSHLVRAFRQHFGTTPGEFIRACRIRRARALLGGRAPIADIAIAVGFADQTQLTRAFTRAVGMPPGAYRRLLHNADKPA